MLRVTVFLNLLMFYRIPGGAELLKTKLNQKKTDVRCETHEFIIIIDYC